MALLRAFSTLGCPQLSLDEALALAVKYGLGAIELRALGGSLDLPAYLTAQFGTPAALAAHLRGARVRVVALNTSLHVIGVTEEERATLLNFIPWAEALGVRWLRVFDGGKNGDATEMAQAVETLAWWKNLRREGGWQADLMVETHDSLFNAAAVTRFLAAAPGTAILWDSHHTWKRGGEDPPATWRAIRASVVHVHVKDSISVPSAKHPYTYVPPGLGEFPAAPLFAVLQADGFAGPVSLEWELMWHPYLSPLEDALGVAAERQWW
jgi:sugar phosphate isomerase/epimerase